MKKRNKNDNNALMFKNKDKKIMKTKSLREYDGVVAVISGVPSS